MTKLPAARTSDIVQLELKGELLLYDLLIHKAYSLNETSALVYKACDGKTSIEELKQKFKFTDDIIFLALDTLKKENLLAENQIYNTPFKGINRREVIRKVGLSTMIALPVINTLIAPTAAHAASAAACQAFGQTCSFNNGTQSNCCDSGARCINNGFDTTCSACLTGGTNTNCNTGAGCCTTVLAFFSNSCCSGVTESPTGFPGVFSCTCN